MSEDASYEDVNGKHDRTPESAAALRRFWENYERLKREAGTIQKYVPLAQQFGLPAYQRDGITPVVKPKTTASDVLDLTDEDIQFLADLKVGV